MDASVAPNANGMEYLTLSCGHAGGPTKLLVRPTAINALAVPDASNGRSHFSRKYRTMCTSLLLALAHLAFSHSKNLPSVMLVSFSSWIPDRCSHDAQQTLPGVPLATCCKLLLCSRMVPCNHALRSQRSIEDKIVLCHAMHHGIPLHAYLSQ